MVHGKHCNLLLNGKYSPGYLIGMVGFLQFPLRLQNRHGPKAMDKLSGCGGCGAGAGIPKFARVKGGANDSRLDPPELDVDVARLLPPLATETVEEFPLAAVKPALGAAARPAFANSCINPPG